ncbi:alternate-type signal peptide domain-containing protein [Serinibacter salmoneus]|uniref:Alternate signal-mediated exported protein n=1 Tax=Serinibacter salmoneus TaxID=556530 RepID=A0A2A9CZM6_9MICO|nr:alternate-type signal peptide domain-containing protein [Serinibacter salmoneus]PFG19049.1 alternate signal-mediated exported protein [Serinibacter salmoneus]
MSKKTTGIIAGAAGAALLLAGGTFALWEGEAFVSNDDLVAGNLEIEFADNTWWDVSDDRTDDPHQIMLESFRIIPGDDIRGIAEFKAALEGDNMVAALAYAVEGYAVGDPTPTPIDGLKLRFDFEYFDGTDWVLLDDNGFGLAAGPFYFASEDNSNNTNVTLPTLPTELPTDPNIRVTLDIEAEDSGEFTTELQLDQLKITLTQTRDAGVGGGYIP